MCVCVKEREIKMERERERQRERERETDKWDRETDKWDRVCVCVCKRERERGWKKKIKRGLFEQANSSSCHNVLSFFCKYHNCPKIEWKDQAGNSCCK